MKDYHFIFNGLFTRLTEKLQMPELQLNSQGLCCMAFGENKLPVQVQVKRNDPLCYFVSHIAKLPPTASEKAEFYSSLLVANAHFETTDNFIFSIHQKENCIQLHHSLWVELLTVDTLEEKLNTFISKSLELSLSLSQATNPVIPTVAKQPDFHRGVTV